MTGDNLPSGDPLRNPREEGLALAKRLRQAAAVALEQAERIEACASRPPADDVREIVFAQGPATAAAPRKHEAGAVAVDSAREARLEFYLALDLVVMALVGHADDPDAVDARAVAQQSLSYAARLAGGFDPAARTLMAERVRRAYHALLDITTKGGRQIEVLRYLNARAADQPDERTVLEMADWASTLGPPETPRASAQALVERARAALLAWAGKGNLKKWEATQDFLREVGLAAENADALTRTWQRRPLLNELDLELEGEWELVDDDDSEETGG